MVRFVEDGRWVIGSASAGAGGGGVYRRRSGGCGGSLLVREAVVDIPIAADPDPPGVEAGLPVVDSGSSAVEPDIPRYDTRPPPVEAGAPDVEAGAPTGEAETPAVDPFEDADALEELGDRIATLAAHIHAAEQRMLVMLADFDRRRGWELGGHRSCAHWLSAGMDLGAARERVRTARVLVGLPQTREAMGKGRLSFSKVRALTRVATPENEGDLLELAEGVTTAQLERMVRAFRKGSRKDEAERERELWESRCFSVFPDGEGMYVVKGRLPAEVGAVLKRAVEAASDALYREERRRVKTAEGANGAAGPDAAPGAAVPGPGRGAAQVSREDTVREARRRRADAVGLLAERALAAGFKGKDAPISGSRAERYQVMLHVEPESLRTEKEGEAPGTTVAAAVPGGGNVSAEPSCCEGSGAGAQRPSGASLAELRSPRTELQDGTRLSAETARRLCCDAAVVRVERGPDGSVLDVGRRTRTIPPSVRRALEVRDGGCRFPGCGLRFTDTHHLIHWADGGDTSLGNCVLLCRHHHRLVHEGSWRVEWWGKDRPVFFDPRGGTHFDGRWQPPDLEDGLEEGETPADALMAANHRRGIRPDGWTAGITWKRERDIPDAVYFRALEAMDHALPGP